MGGKIGIDVGGTFTDAVLIEEGSLERKAKVPTDQDNILQTIVNAFDGLSLDKSKSPEQITVSTTLVTNAILQKRFPSIELYLMPGTGMALDALPWPVSYTAVSGQIDYRGREIVPPNELEWRRLIQQRKATGAAQHIAIVGKFSHRNSRHEEQLAALLHQAEPEIKIALGHQWGQANFYRRSLTTYLNLASTDLFNQFALGFEQAVVDRGFQIPIKILKADGGVFPLKQINPVETIYSGPTASVLGGLAQNSKPSFVIVDIGGTTTDIGITLSRAPLLSSFGAKIGAFSTMIRSLAVRSVPVGGDSAILKPEGEEWSIADYRLGPAYCLGGPAPTPTDAMRFLGLTEHGDCRRAEAALAGLIPPEKRNPEELHYLAVLILKKVAERIAEAIESLEREWQEEPAYKIWGVLHPHEALHLDIWASGGGAKGLKPFLEKRLHTGVHVGKHHEVSNAVGAALSRPTFTCTLHLDTVLKRYQIAETGEQGDWEGSKRPHLEVEPFLKNIASRLAGERGVDLSAAQDPVFDYFPVVQGYRTVGQIVQGCISVPPGVTDCLR